MNAARKHGHEAAKKRKMPPGGTIQCVAIVFISFIPTDVLSHLPALSPNASKRLQQGVSLQTGGIRLSTVSSQTSSPRRPPLN